MLYDLIGITSDATVILSALLGAAVMFGIPAIALVMIVRYRSKVAIAQKIASAPLSEFRFDIFLSYSSTDRTHALEVSKKLQEAGIRTFFADRQLEAGMPFTEEIRKALHDSRETWLLASPASIASTWVATEWGTAWALDRKIVPILLNLSVNELPDRLRLLQTVTYEAMENAVTSAKARFLRNARREP